MATNCSYTYSLPSHGPNLVVDLQLAVRLPHLRQQDLRGVDLVIVASMAPRSSFLKHFIRLVLLFREILGSVERLVVVHLSAPILAIPTGLLRSQARSTTSSSLANSWYGDLGRDEPEDISIGSFASMSVGKLPQQQAAVVEQHTH